MQKTARIGMRIDPAKKERWVEVADKWGYSGLSSFLEGMADWAIAFEDFDGNYQAYVKYEGNLTAYNVAKEMGMV